MNMGERTVTDIPDVTNISTLQASAKKTPLPFPLLSALPGVSFFCRLPESPRFGAMVGMLSWASWTLTPYAYFAKYWNHRINPFFSQRCYKENITRQENKKRNTHFCRNPVARNLEPTERQIAPWVAHQLLIWRDFWLMAQLEMRR